MPALSLLFLLAPIAILVATMLMRRGVVNDSTLIARLSELARALGGRMFGDTSFSAEHRGRPYSVGVTRSAKNTPSSISIELTLRGEREAPAAEGDYRRDVRPHLRERPWIVLRRETFLDRLGKALGINREIEVGDAAFDRAVYIESDAPPADVARILGEPRLRAAVVRVIALGYPRLTLHDGADAVRVRRDLPTAAQVSTESVREVLDLLDLVAASLPTFESDEIASAPRPFAQRTAVLLPTMVVPTLAFIFAMVAAQLSHLVRSRGIMLSLFAGALLWLPVAFLLGRAMRGRSDSFRRFLWVGIPLLVTLMCAAAGALPLLNDRLDGERPTVHDLRITRRYITRSKSNTYYHVHVEGYDGGGDFELPRAQAYYDQVRVGDVMAVEVHPGALGWAWVGRTWRR